MASPPHVHDYKAPILSRRIDEEIQCVAPHSAGGPTALPSGDDRDTAAAAVSGQNKGGVMKAGGGASSGDPEERRVRSRSPHKAVRVHEKEEEERHRSPLFDKDVVPHPPQHIDESLSFASSSSPLEFGAEALPRSSSISEGSAATTAVTAVASTDVSKTTTQVAKSRDHREDAGGGGCVRIPIYSDINPENWVARVVGKNVMGSPTVYIYDSLTRATPEFCLYKDEECSTIVFKLEPRSDAERPSFMTGAEAAKKVESLELSITLEGDQFAFVRQVDERCKKLALENSKEWFGRTCTATEIDVMYTSPIKMDETGRWAPHLRAKINLSGIDKYLTQVTYVRDNNVPEEGCGWEFVEPRLGEQKWRDHRARVVLEVRRLWIVNRKFGITYSIRDIAVRERPQKRATPFLNDNSLDCL